MCYTHQDIFHPWKGHEFEEIGEMYEDERAESQTSSEDPSSVDEALPLALSQGNSGVGDGSGSKSDTDSDLSRAASR